MKRERRTDPDRRDRIIDACLEVIAEHGVAGASHRRVAASADVPLGSMTYHFAGMDDLLHEAFGRFADEQAHSLETLLEGASSAEAVLAAFADWTEANGQAGGRSLVLTHELYTLAARRPEFRDLTTRWMTRTRAALAPWFDERTAVLLDAMSEGLTIHRALHTSPEESAQARAAFQRLAQH